MICTWENCTHEAKLPLILSRKGPVLAKLCVAHYQEFMDAPRATDVMLADGVEDVVAKLRKAIHNMPVQLPS